MTTNSPPASVRAPGLPKIAKVSVPVSILKPGNVVGHLLTFFEIYSDGTTYKAVAISSDSHKVLGHLPDAIHFDIQEGKAVNVDTCYRFIVADLLNALRKEGLL
jgi:hypothetical protein